MPASTKIVGGNPAAIFPATEQIVDGAFGAARVSARPLDHTSPYVVLGHYRWTGSTSAILAGANAILFSMRWSDAARLLVLERLSASVTVVTAVTGQRTDPLVATIQRSYTANETTLISTAAVPSRARATMNASSLVAQIGAATGAAGISGGTRTADAVPFSTIPLQNVLGLGTGTSADDFIRYDNPVLSYPIVLGVNEGITVAWGATALATGTVEVNFAATWAEVVQF